MGRLKDTVTPDLIGIGLEEDTAIYTNGNQFHVLGSGLITLIDGIGITSTNIYEIGTGEPFAVPDLRVRLLSNGACNTLPTYDQLQI